MILFLTLMMLLLTLALGVMVCRYRKLQEYTRQSVKDRLALAEELSQLKEQADFINFRLYE